MPFDSPSDSRKNTAAGRLSSRSRKPHARRRGASSARTGAHRLGLASGRDGLLYVPPRYQVERPAPLLIALHGAGGHAQHAIDLVHSCAEDSATIVLAIDSRATTWDVIVDELGPDVAFLDAALARTFDEYAIDPSRVAISGFSDGASYALTLGVSNGDLFDGIAAFSPGFLAKAPNLGRPRVFVSHGMRDAVLPIDTCSRRLVPRLTKRGYDVTYREFDGPHTVPIEIVREAFEWLAMSPRAS